MRCYAKRTRRNGRSCLGCVCACVCVNEGKRKGVGHKGGGRRVPRSVQRLPITFQASALLVRCAKEMDERRKKAIMMSGEGSRTNERKTKERAKRTKQKKRRGRARGAKWLARVTRALSSRICLASRAVSSLAPSSSCLCMSLFALSRPFITCCASCREREKEICNGQILADGASSAGNFFWRPLQRTGGNSAGLRNWHQRKPPFHQKKEQRERE